MSLNAKSGEFTLIRELRRRAVSNGRVAIGIGDDCASVRLTEGAEVLVTTDMLIDGRHFEVDSASIEEIGYKCLAVNLSDIAAMAGRPVAAVVAVALPRSRAVELALGLERGMAPLAAEFDVALVGGDTNAWDGPLVVALTVIGEATQQRPVRRSGAKSGDAIFVTGPLGASLLGRHLRPMPRIKEALALHAVADLHSMIDISDGLAADLGHILEESGGLGATLDIAAIPIHEDARRLAERDGSPGVLHALGDGEDFELCFTVDPSTAVRLLDAPPAGVTLFRIGTIEAEPGLRLRQFDGHVVACDVAGFDHLADPILRDDS